VNKESNLHTANGTYNNPSKLQKGGQNMQKITLTVLVKQ
jgi:hypothetical protein